MDELLRVRCPICGSDDVYSTVLEQAPERFDCGTCFHQWQTSGSG